MKKPAVPTVEEIAAKHGWEYAPQRVKGDYKFRKGDLTIRFSRLGNGCLDIRWRNFRVPWNPRLPDPHDKEKLYYIHLSSREEYLDVLLAQVNLEVAFARVEDHLAGEYATQERKLKQAADVLAEFRRESAKASG